LECLAFLRYVEDIRTVQPNGPYYLGFFCGLGVVGFEIAQQLHQQGETIAFLGMFEAGAPVRKQMGNYLRHRAYFNVQRVRSHWANLASLSTRGQANYIAEMIRSFVRRTRTRFRRQFERLVYKLCLTIGRPVPERLKDARAMRGEMASRYVPQVFPGRISVFVGDLADFVLDPKLGWEGLAAGGVEVRRVRGNHTNMLREPNVKVLAGELNICLV